MKNEKNKPGKKELTDAVEEETADKSASVEKKKKNKQVDGPLTAVPKEKKVKKVKSEKDANEKVEPKDQKVQKDDKLNKFLVSMKKTLRKSLKKEAAEAGISMNEYIVLAVEEKLNKAANKL